MLNSILIKNFKSLKDVRLSLTSLNILAGLNGSGKSSLIQALLLLRQSVKKDGSCGLILQGEDFLHLGTGKDVFYQYAGRDELIEFALADDNANNFLWQFRYEISSDLLPFSPEHKNSLLPDLHLFRNNFQYLNTEHLSSNDIFPRSESHVKTGSIGPRGEYSAHYLAEYGISQQIACQQLQHPSARSLCLIHQVDAWLGEISPGVRLIAEDIKSMGQARLAFKFETKDGYTNEIKPVNTGFGISYVLPVVLAILKARKGDLLIIENPESHLHPKGQSVLGRMMACAAMDGIQILAETHSDHFINGVRVAVKNGMPPSISRVFYFDRILGKTEQYCEVETINFDKNGELSSYPRGFLDEWNEQLMQLI
ncbi:AAA family ATPase [Desulfobacter sp.]